MDPSRDNTLIRFTAFWWGIGVISLFFVILLLVRLTKGGDEGGDPLEESARFERLEIRNQVDAAQQANLAPKVVEEGVSVQVLPEDAFEMLGKQLLAAKPSKVEDPAQVIPGTASAEALASAPEADSGSVDALTPPDGTVPDPAVMEKGKLGYMLCAACHGVNGEGGPDIPPTGPLAPPLAKSEWVLGPVSNLIRIQFRGLDGPIMVGGTEYTPVAAMAAMGAASSDEDVAAVLTYIRNSFGNTAPPVLIEQVKALRSEIGKPVLTVSDLIPVK